jgi:hypothetical protein
VVGFCLLLIAGGYTYRTNVELATSFEWIAHSQEVGATLAAVYGSLAARHGFRDMHRRCPRLNSDTGHKFEPAD